MKQLELAGIAPAVAPIKTKRKTYAGAPPVCNICKLPFGNQMYDSKTSKGAWANMCHVCFTRYGCGLGTGLGQRYVLEPEGWIKVAG